VILIIDNMSDMTYIENNEKTRQTPQTVIEICKKRIKEYNNAN